MKGRHNRHRAIEQIIQSNRITSQDALLEHLTGMGFSVTQATLSRDLRHLKDSKVSEGPGGYHYTLPGEESRRELEGNYIQDFLRGFVSLEFSANIGVVRTLTGHANSVALALDRLSLTEILGTIAGDDTVLMVLREGVGPGDMKRKLREKFPDLED